MKMFLINVFLILIFFSCNDSKKRKYTYLEEQKNYEYITQINKLDSLIQDNFLKIKKPFYPSFNKLDTIDLAETKDNYLDTLHRFYKMEFFEDKNNTEILLFSIDIKFILCLLKNSTMPVWGIKSTSYKTKYLNLFNCKTKLLFNSITIEKNKIVTATRIMTTFESTKEPIYWDTSIYLAIHSKSKVLQNKELIIDNTINKDKKNFVEFIQKGLCKTKNKIILKIYQDPRLSTTLSSEDLPNIEYKITN